jgi:hypothetical protein
LTSNLVLRVIASVKLEYILCTSGEEESYEDGRGQKEGRREKENGDEVEEEESRRENLYGEKGSTKRERAYGKETKARARKSK